MHRPEIVREALRLRDEQGLGARVVARRLGLPLGTVRDWHAGKLPRSIQATCMSCGHPPHRFADLGPDYVHLLGLYLGDGSISTHRRGVHRLRVFLDVKYPRIVAECVAAMEATIPRNRASVQATPYNCFAVSGYSRSWPCLFPQHGPGRKHERLISLTAWQQGLAERWPERLLRGLIQSDGCRSHNSSRSGWRQTRYAFSNVSTDVTSIFCTACDRLGLRWTASFPTSESAAVSIYVSRKADVARLDELVGPKR